MSAVVTRTEAARLAALEATIERGLETFVEVGEALREIRDAGLYRPDHATFEVYCQARWGMSRSYAHRTIEAASVTATLPNGNKPTNEAQARELTRLADPAARQRAWGEATARAEEEDRRVTASDVRAAVAARLPKASPAQTSEGASSPAPSPQPDPLAPPTPDPPRSPAECAAAVVAGCDRLVRATNCIDIESAVRDDRGALECWLSSFSAARDALDELIERAQRGEQ